MIQTFRHRDVKYFDHHRCLVLLVGLLLAIPMPGLGHFAWPERVLVDLVSQTWVWISAARDPKILARTRLMGLPGDLTTLARLYTGAVVIDSRNLQWLLPSQCQ
jgi:hypothetical protein